MSPQLAKQVFDILLSELRSNGLTDIGTFLLPEQGRDGQYSKYSAEYKYTDTDTELFDLEASSHSPDSAVTALKLLLHATLEYFSIATTIPEQFQNQLKNLPISQIDSPAIIGTINDSQVDYNTVLNNSSTAEFIELLKLINDNIDEDDNTFLELTNVL